ncbi:ExeM/NucH family extracellular endonuclease [Thiocystis violascens]|uniref:Putative extracellular nuclease n=1 Tax=Thiocystis violascens (strain ATCC 17096 / DSM 198 / 6111) TaxID=765911 RepID=I3YF61_THIV6|nr:ExeM/NucH family extracellular endonuclease [Thiocystis violascens]AFL75629.1 putative extracellular nuclease [Thiocystis violascens DSM 198]
MARVFINEFHYDNLSTDAGEFIEIAGPAGTDLTGWSIVLYNGNGGAFYDTEGLSGTIPDQGNGFGTVIVNYPVDGIQNGAPDGIALVDHNGAVVQFLSYEGTFTAVGGAADGLLSTNVGVVEPNTTPVGNSLQLTGTGSLYEDFTWSGPTANTSGDVNVGQTFVAPADNSVDLSTYVRIGRYDLPEPTRTAAPNGSQLALEVSAVTYNPTTDTLFVVGDEGTSIIQVTKTGQLIDSMTLESGAFEDTEGLTYLGAGKFALVEERLRQVNLFTYTPDTTLTRADVQTVKLGTTIGNIGLEGMSYDPLTDGYVLVKETGPQGIFQTGIDFTAGTATNGSASTENATNLFDPALAGLTDFADVYALSNLQPTDANLLLLGQEDGRIVNIDRGTGTISNSLQIAADPENPLAVSGQGFEGLTMDSDGLLYVTSEQGGGDGDHPQLWVYAPASYTYENAAPVAVSLSNALSSLAENSDTTAAVKVGDIIVSDDALGTNTLSLTGTDAAAFEIVGTELFLKAGTTLDFGIKPSLQVTVNVDDASLGGISDAAAAFTLPITDTSDNASSLMISEVAPWSSGNSSLGADWFEVTNTGTSAVDISGWRFDDDSSVAANGSDLGGVTSIGSGQSVVFVDGDANTVTAFVNTWFGGILPSGVTIGTYDGPGLGTGGDAVNLFDATGTLVTGVSFGASPSASPFATFDNATGQPTVSTLSEAGVNGAFSVIDQAAILIGSPGAISGAPVSATLVAITATDAAAAEEVQNPGAFAVLRTGDTTAPLEVTYSIGGDAEAADYTPSLPTTVTIPAGASEAIIVVTPVDDDLAETNESLTLTLVDSAAYDVVANAASATVTIADNDTAAADFNLQISEMWPGNAEGSDLTADWFEITNTGTEAWVSGVAPNLYYDDGSQDPTTADLINGISQIAPGNSVIVVVGNAADAQTFATVWGSVIDLAGIDIGYTDGAGLGAGGDGVSLFVGLPAPTDTPADFEEYPNTTGSEGRSYDVDLAAFSVAGQNGAVATAPNDANESAVGSPGIADNEGGDGNLGVFTLELLHAADQEAGAAAVQDAPNFSAVLNALRAQDLGNDGEPDNTLTLSSGDAFIPGLFYGASKAVFGSAGIADIQIQNELGFQAIAFGNHEFDFGTSTLAKLIDGSAPGGFSKLSGSALEGLDFAGTAFPYLSTNLDFSADANLAPLEVAGGQAPQANAVTSSTVIDVNGENVGVVGATTPALGTISSPGDVTSSPEWVNTTPTDAELDALAAGIQLEVDALLAANPGMNKVILLAHMQKLDVELALAERLTDVDIIVAGGSNTRLFDDNDAIRPGDSDQGQYPQFVTNAGGTTTAVVNTDGSYKYVGRLVIDFDADGHIIADSYDETVSGAYATDDTGVAALDAEGLIDPEIQAIADAIQAQIIATESNVFGVSDVFLNGNRTGTDTADDPDGVRSQETNLGDLTADANLAAAQSVDPTVVISIKNGGGIRASIGQTVVPPGGGDYARIPNEEIVDGDGNVVKPAGGISQNDIQTSLAFNNGLTLLTLTKAELVAILEHGVGDIGGGRFPQVSGVKFSYDPDLVVGDRIVSAGIFDENDSLIAELVRDGEIVGDATETFRIVTLNFLAGGGDGYPFPTGPEANRVDLTDLDDNDEPDRNFTGDATFVDNGSEQDALAEYLLDRFNTPESVFDQEDTGRDLDERIQNLDFRDDTVLPEIKVFISEFHYDNDGTDEGEFVEVTADAGADLTGYSIVLYNGNGGASYATYALSGSVTDQASGQGTMVVSTSGLQNGSPDGMALVDADGNVVEFLSYEGMFTANGGPAAGMTSTDVGVLELSDTPVGQSLQLINGVWTDPAAASKGQVNTATGSDFDLQITEIWPGQDGADVTADWFEITNVGAAAWVSADDPDLYYDDDSADPTVADPIRGISAIAPGESAIVVIGDSVDVATFIDVWGDVISLDGVAVGYTDGAGLGNGGDAVTLFVGGPTVETIADSEAYADSDVFDGQSFDVTANAYSVAGENGSVATLELGGGDGDVPAVGSPGNGAPIIPVELTRIGSVQGSGTASPFAGQTLTVEAIVVGDFQNGDVDAGRNLGGFYLQEEDPDADGNPLTSEGLFVFEGNTFLTDVSVGDRVQVTGIVTEYFGETQLQASGVTLIGSGNPLPTAAAIDLPSAAVSTAQGGDFQPDLEAYEGMLVSFSETLTITEMFQLDRFNEIKLSAEGRLEQFTQSNAPDAAGYQQHLQDIGARTIVYDDGLNVQNALIGNLDGFGPTFDTATDIRIGDTLANLTGVLDYKWAGNSASGSTWRVRATQDDENTFDEGNARPADHEPVGGSLKAVSLNVLNYFATINEGGNQTANALAPRGANSSDEFARQTEKLVTAILTMDADIYGLVELENDFLAGSTGNAIDYLVGELNAIVGDGVYDWVDPGTQFVGSDAIAVGFIYNTERVQPVGAAAILDDPSFLDPMDSGMPRNRASLAQTFEDTASGETFTAVVNHLKSKGDSGLTGDPQTNPDLDQGDGQGYWNATRTEAAEALADWLATDPTDSGDRDFLLLGDFNAYAMEDPIVVLRDRGFTDLAQHFVGPDAYSYVFDGQIGTLDYAFASETLFSQVTDATEWHINADEADALDYNLDFGRDFDIFDGTLPYRTSDHDPVIVGLDLSSQTPVITISGTSARDKLVGTDAAELFDGNGGSDVILTGGGHDIVDLSNYYQNGLREAILLADFDPTQDQLDGISSGNITRALSFGDRTLAYLDNGDMLQFIGVSDFADVEFTSNGVPG